MRRGEERRGEERRGSEAEKESWDGEEEEEREDEGEEVPRRKWLRAVRDRPQVEQRSRVTVPSHYCIVDIFILIVRDRVLVIVICLPVCVSMSIRPWYIYSVFSVCSVILSCSLYAFYLYMPVSNIGLDAVTIRYYTKQGFESRSHTSSDRA